MTPRIFAIATAFAAATSTAAFAQSTLAPENLISADKIEEGSVYALSLESEDRTWVNGERYVEIDKSWERVGDISDVLLDQDGKVVAILAEIGGFLGIGDHDVILPLESIRIAQGTESDYHFVTNLTEVDEDIWD